MAVPLQLALGTKLSEPRKALIPARSPWEKSEAPATTPLLICPLPEVSVTIASIVPLSGLLTVSRPLRLAGVSSAELCVPGLAIVGAGASRLR